MNSNSNNRKKNRSSGKAAKNILKLYIITVFAAIIIASFTFSFTMISVLTAFILVTILFVFIQYMRNKKDTRQYVHKNNTDNYNIDLYQAKKVRDDTKVLRRDNLNFVLSDEIDKKETNSKKPDLLKRETASEGKAAELKKRYNPYKSPFEPINTENEAKICEAEKVINTSNINEELENSGMDIGSEDNSCFEEELFIPESQTIDEVAAVTEAPYDFKETNRSIESVESIDTEFDDLERGDFTDYEAEALNIVKFRPRFINKNTEIKQVSEDIKESQKEEQYEYPPYELLRTGKIQDSSFYELEEQETAAIKLIDTLASFGVGAKVMDISRGPSVTRYELQPNPGVKVSKIVGLADDIALNLAATGVRIEAPIPGKAAVGIEVPNKEITPVLFGDVIKSQEFIQHSSKLAFALGRDVAGRTIVGDVAKMPHLLIAGATGSGKSVCINTLISSIIYKASPSEVKLLLVDPKVVELGIYNGIPHLLIPVVTDPKKAAGALSWAVLEMTNRYRLFAENNVRDLKGYNSQMKTKNEPTLPQIVIIIDELADLMMVAPNDVEDCICRLAQMARAAGMHLVIATQRPSVDVITGVIKANIPSRISFAVSSQIDSRTILDMAGAEKLLGRGDMLFNPIGEMKPLRVQGSFVSDSEVEALVSYLKSLHTVTYDQDVLEKINAKDQQPAQNEANDDDELLPQVVDMVIDFGQASASLIQRKFKVGYSRAARILDQMESWGIVGPADGSKPRQILITRQEWEELNS